MVVGVLVGFVVGVWWQLRAVDRAYRLALDHIEQMTRPGRIGTYELDDALAKLREETSQR